MTIDPLIRLTRPGFDSDPFGDFIEVRYAERQLDGSLAVAQPVGMIVHKREEMTCVATQPMLRIPTRANNVLQSMMQQLWDMGIRPAGINSVGVDNAKESHLQDMRALVANFIKVKLPGTPAATQHDF